VGLSFVHSLITQNTQLSGTDTLVSKPDCPPEPSNTQKLESQTPQTKEIRTSVENAQNLFLVLLPVDFDDELEWEPHGSPASSDTG
jgi:hypothetical protein